MGRRSAGGRPGRPKKRKYHATQPQSPPEGPVLTSSTPEINPEIDGTISAAINSDEVFSVPDHFEDDEISGSSGSSGDEFSSESDSECEVEMTGFRLVDIECLLQLLVKSVCCQDCHSTIALNEVDMQGLATCLEISCTKCGERNSAFMSGRYNRVWEVNRRSAFGMRWIGRGRQSLVKFCAAMNMPPPMHAKAYDGHAKALSVAAKVTAEASMCDAAQDLRRNAGVQAQQPCDVAVTYDGTWMRRGYASLYGAFIAISWETGKVLDYQTLSRYCLQCSRLKKLLDQRKISQAEYDDKMTSHSCSSNTKSSAPAMEAEAAKQIWQRSVQLRQARYTTFIGDGDTKSFKSVCDAAPYGPDVAIIKEECVGHVQKRVGSNLRKLKREMSGKKLEDGLSISGRGRLTEKTMDKLQALYGLAVRSNTDNLQGMARAIWASLMHSTSTDSKPAHQYCPPGADSWCKWQKAQAGGETYVHHDAIPEAVFKAVKPIYLRLTERRLLEGCLRGATQNRNECINGMIWQMCPKTSFCGAGTVETAVALATAWFNNPDNAIESLFSEMGLPVGVHTAAAVARLASQRRYDAARKSLDVTKKARKKRRRLKKGVSDDQADEEGVTYEPGGF